VSIKESRGVVRRCELPHAM